MTDLEITRACAEAMGYKPTGRLASEPAVQVEDHRQHIFAFDPLHDDAQAMALVKKHNLHITPPDESDGWIVSGWGGFGKGNELNRAICECVAKMQKEKT